MRGSRPPIRDAGDDTDVLAVTDDMPFRDSCSRRLMTRRLRRAIVLIVCVLLAGGTVWTVLFIAQHFREGRHAAELSFQLERRQVTDWALLHRCTRINLRGLDINESHLQQLKRFPALKYLDLTGTPITDEGMRHLKDLSRLEWLWLSDTQVTDAGLVHLKGLKNLTWLRLEGTQVSDVGLPHLKDMRSLEWVILTDTHVTGDGLVHLLGLPNLERLGLNGTDVHDKDVAYLKQMAQLKIVDLTNTQVTDAGVEELQHALPSATISRIGVL